MSNDNAQTGSSWPRIQTPQERARALRSVQAELYRKSDLLWEEFKLATPFQWGIDVAEGRDPYLEQFKLQERVGDLRYERPDGPTAAALGIVNTARYIIQKPQELVVGGLTLGGDMDTLMTAITEMDRQGNPDRHRLRYEGRNGRGTYEDYDPNLDPFRSKIALPVSVATDPWTYVAGGVAKRVLGRTAVRTSMFTSSLDDVATWGQRSSRPASGAAHNAANFERLKAQLAQQEILTSTPTGSALKGSGPFSPRTFGRNLDVDHRSAVFLQDTASQGRHFTVLGGDRVSRNLFQVPNQTVNGRRGIVEYLVGPNGLEHQRFISGGRITGTVNQVPGKLP